MRQNATGARSLALAKPGSRPADLVPCLPRAQAFDRARSPRSISHSISTLRLSLALRVYPYARVRAARVGAGPSSQAIVCLLAPARPQPVHACCLATTNPTTPPGSRLPNSDVYKAPVPVASRAPPMQRTVARVRLRKPTPPGIVQNALGRPVLYEPRLWPAARRPSC